jgi:uncharacterized membrane protein
VNEINVIEAWRLWLSGNLSPNATIFGVSIFWWGRLGKTMQFVGAITIIADIIGPAKIRSFGASLHGAITSTTLMQFLRHSFRWYTIMFRYTLMKDYVDENRRDSIANSEIEEETKQFQLDLLNGLICLILTLIVMLSIELPQDWWVFLVEAAIVFFCLLVSISPTLTVLTVVSFIIAGLAFNLVFIQPLAWVLEHPSLDRFTKVASLLFLLVGFHFELLAS